MDFYGEDDTKCGGKHWQKGEQVGRKGHGETENG